MAKAIKKRAKSAVKKAATKRSRGGDQELRPPAGIKLLELEDNVPLPSRGVRDPEFVEKIRYIARRMKKDQSFVVPKHKLHSTKKIFDRDFPEYKVRVAVINPDKKFARVWRTA